MSRIPVLRVAWAVVGAGGLVFVLALAGIALPARAATADAATGLEAPMQPIAKGGAAGPGCGSCTGGDPQDGNGQRVAERSAPEFSAPRRPTMMMSMSPESEGALAPQLEPVVHDVDPGSLLSLPGASITVPAVLP